MLSPYPVYRKTGTSDWAEDGLAFGIPKTAMKDKMDGQNYTSKYTVATLAGYDEPIAGKIPMSIQQRCRSTFQDRLIENFSITSTSTTIQKLFPNEAV